MNNTFINEDYKVKMGGRKAPSISEDDLIAYLQAELINTYDWFIKNGGTSGNITDPSQSLETLKILDEYFNSPDEVGDSPVFKKIMSDITPKLDTSGWFENIGDPELGSLNGKIPFIKITLAQDYTRIGVVFIYWDGSDLRAYVPMRGNWINAQTKQLFGEDEDADADEVVRQGLDQDFLDNTYEPVQEKCLEEFGGRLGLTVQMTDPADDAGTEKPGMTVINSDIPYGRIRYTPVASTMDQFYKTIRQKLNKFSGIAKDDMKQGFPGLTNVMALSNGELIELMGNLLYWTYIARQPFALGTECKDDLGDGGYSNDTADPDTQIIEDGILATPQVPYIRFRVRNAYGLEHVVYFFYDGTNFRGYIPLVGNWIYPKLMQTYEGAPTGSDGSAWLDECEKDFEACFIGTKPGQGAVDPNSLEGQDVAVLVNLLQAIEDYDNIHEVQVLRVKLEEEIQKKNG